jgi:hypothetical protein
MPHCRRSGLDYSQDGPYNTPVCCLSRRSRVFFCAPDQACSSTQLHIVVVGGDLLIFFGRKKALDGLTEEAGVVVNRAATPNRDGELSCKRQPNSYSVCGCGS